MSIREIEVASLGALVDCLTPPEPDPATGRRRDAHVYRGSAAAHGRLLTSLDRLGGTEPAHTKCDLEEHILRNFARYSRPHLPHSASEWELLFAAQHHGVPTRLLDWSYSPLVAAHFAAGPAREHEPRVIWRLDWKRVHRAFGLPELALLIEDLDGFFGEGESYTPWRLMARRARARARAEAQGAAGRDDGRDTGRDTDGSPRARDFMCMLEPPTLDVRIAAQSAVFTLCSDTTRPVDLFLESHGLGDALTRFIIPADRVAFFRDQLDLVTMDERRLFPDLDGVAAQMRRYYG